MRIVADLHTHTIVSVHAYCTASEMIAEASRLGLAAIALTDHGAAMHGVPHKFYFMNLHAIPDVVSGVRVLKGIEANITDFDGTLDLEDDILSRLDFRIASMHMPTLHGVPTVDKCTDCYLRLADNPNVDMIAHSGSPYYAYDYENVIKKFARNGKLIEINNSSVKNKPDYVPNCKKIAALCKKHCCRIAVNTDSHFYTQLGRADEALDMLTELEFPEELIVNASVGNLELYLKEKGLTLH